MNRQNLIALLEAVQRGELTPKDGLKRLEHLPFENLGFARVDHHSSLRQGFPEVVFGLNKKPEHVAAIVRSLLPHKTNILVTHCPRNVFTQIKRLSKKARYHDAAQATSIVQDSTLYGDGVIHVVCAGTSDIPVAEEAAITARLMGNTVQTTFDVGVAGIHRLLSVREALTSARVIVVVAGR